MAAGWQYRTPVFDPDAGQTEEQGARASHAPGPVAAGPGHPRLTTPHAAFVAR